ncbi:FitA-like ribbon-helix-helix domain-containing protein [Dyella flagellata]|uniref:Antitoxin n=1 Tax=Dyella flagellata TaxID=1867833 RepID=A0ABQ5XCB1_9GAMM|nr:Arc family DNA-binding protein [Dyella flagellata]GLQ89285.1 antitoxin [Dyella flagellata]
MAAITIRNVPEEVHRALRVRAAMHGRSTEAEIRDILEDAVKPEGRVKLGSLLAEIGREAGGLDLEIERDKTPTEPLSFE